MVIDERTPLRKAAAGQQGPPYVFVTNPNRVYRRKVKQFQCFLCGIVLASFTTALVITLIYSVEHDVEDIKPTPSPVANASLQTLLSMSWPLQDVGVPVWQGPEPSDSELNNAISTGQLSLQTRDIYEANMASLPVSSPSYRHQQSIKTSVQATDLARSGYVMNVATLTFIKPKRNLTSTKTSVGRGDQLGLEWLPRKECGQGPLPPCPVSPYRSIDGTCNNLYRPTQWGVAMRPFRRQLPPDYADGVLSPRMASDGSPLPSAREVSVTVHPAQYRGEAKFTVMLAVWGQFIDHDITSTALSLGKGGKPISCCGTNNTVDMHPECYPVHVSKDDSYYKDNSVYCMEFVRSAPAPACALGPREQLNQVSSFIDASLVYGNTPQLSQSLRTFQGGQLKMSHTPDGRTLLPISTIPNDGCNTEEENAKGRYCFMSGDPRGNENLHLTTLHLLMARQHNQLAQKLSTLNPDWNDEKIYQESRKIVAAQMQHITYNEFLPVLLGDEIMETLDLNPQKSGYYNGYNSSVDPSASNNFATAAFRFAHSLLPGLIKSLANDTSSNEYVELHKILFNPYSLYNSGQLDRSVNSAINTNVERVDTFFNKQVTQHLFEKSEKNHKAKSYNYGLDLVSLNIQRGRDHGLPTYPNWREFCGLSRPKTFDDMTGYVDEDSLSSLKAVYKQVDDVDVYSGALSELPIQGGMLGPTLTCLISDQFVRLKQGDSFWYENPFVPQGFTPGQLNEIRKTSLAKIVCETSDNITQVQPLVMQNVGPGNTRMSCDSLPSLDLSEWLSPSEGTVSKPYTRIGLTVTGGSIETDDGGVLWSGEMRAAIPVALFDSVLSEASGFPGASVYFGHGIQWAGSLTVQLNEMTIQGIFSLPQYIHKYPGSFLNFTTNWVNGKFKFTSKILWNSSEIDSLKLDQSYSSPLYLSEQAAKSSVSLNKQFATVETPESDLPKIIGYVKCPVILKGSFSPDKKLFYWSGNLTATVPNQSVLNMKGLSSTKKNKTKGAFSVIDGTLTSTSSDGHVATLWSGNPPVQITLPKCSSSSQSSTTLLYGLGVMWLSSVTDYKLEGTFSFPYFENMTVTWLNGDFVFNIIPVLNVSLQGILTPGIKYSTKFILKQGKMVTDSLQLLTLFDNLTANSGSLQSYIEDSQDVLDGVVPAPLILFGNFTPDKCLFNWSGDVIVAVRKSKEKLNQQFTLLKNAEPAYKSWPKSRFGGTVISGTLTASLNETSNSVIWNGVIPVSIPMPTFWSPTSDTGDGKEFIFSKGILWTGMLSGTTIQGEYSLPQCIWNGSVATTQVWKGKFIFDITPIWNTSLTDVFVPGAKYYSKINFKGTKTIETLNVCSGLLNDEVSSALLAPLILQGTYSPDKKLFYWSGNFIIAFNNGPLLGFNLPKPQPKTVLGKTNGEIKTSVTVSVTSGQIWASPVGENYTNIWNGEFPVTVPLTSIVNPDSYDLITDFIWTGQVVDNKFEGNFSIPIYKQNGTQTSTAWWSGNFSFSYTTKWDASLESLFSPLKKYTFQLLFQPQFKSSSSPSKQKPSENTLLTQFAMDAQETLDSTGKGKIVLVGDFYSKPFYCYVLPFCSEKNEFYWSGEAFFTVITPITPHQPPELPPEDPPEVEPVLSAVDSGAVKDNQQFGAQVVGGYIKAGLDDRPMNTWWTGEIPVNIPLPVFWNSDSAFASSDVISNGVIWSGTLYGTLFEGTFSLPQYGWNGISRTVQWWNGEFSFKLQPLWYSPANTLVMPNMKYYSRINFHDFKHHNLSASVNSPSQVDVDTAIPAPIVLQGTDSPDGSTFLWNGKVLISFKNAANEFNLLESSLPSIKVNDKVLPENLSKPVKPAKSSARLSVTGGNISAANETGNITEIWSGQLPAAIDLGLFVHEGSFFPTTVVNMTIETLTSNLEGTFAIQTYKNNTVSLTEHWIGNFTFAYTTKWDISLASVVNEKQSYSCKLIFSEFKAKLSNSIDNDSKKLKTVIVRADESKNLLCRLVLIGNYDTQPVYCSLLPFLCSESNIFYWSGDAILSISQPAPASVKNKNQLKATTMMYRRLGATIISGYVIGNIGSQYPKPLWSGEIPAVIPLPVFWSSDTVEPSLEPTVYGHGLIWSGSQIGSLIQGTFSLPQYVGNGMFSTVRWWYGQFSFLLEPSWNLTLVDFIRPGINYNSRIMFHDADKVFLQSPSQDDVNSALHIPIVLLGRYSPDRKIFFWNGRVIIAFHEFPDAYFSDNLYLSSNIQATNLLQKPIFNKKVKPQTNVGLIALSGNISMYHGNSTSQWNGSLPVSIPLNLLSNNTTYVGAVNVIWSAVVSDSQISGNFSLPQTQPVDSNFTIEWLSGSFSFKFTTLWNTSTDIIKTQNKHSCWLIFKNSNKLVNSPKADSLQQLIMDSEVIDGTQSCTIMLVGLLDPDTQMFTWSGQAWINVKMNKSKDSLTIRKQPLSEGVLINNRFGGSVYNGEITASGEILWSGSIPVAIPVGLQFASKNSSTPVVMSDLFVDGLTWFADVANPDITGTFSFPQYTWNGLVKQVTWIKGEFTFRIRPFWNSSLSDIISPSVKYISNIHFQNVKTNKTVTTNLDGNTSVSQNIINLIEKDTETLNMTHIILQGEFSADMSVFYWSGNFILSVPSSETAP